MSDFAKIMYLCNEIFSYQIYIGGYLISLKELFIYLLVGFVLLWFLFRLLIRFSFNASLIPAFTADFIINQNMNMFNIAIIILKNITIPIIVFNVSIALSSANYFVFIL